MSHLEVAGVALLTMSHGLARVGACYVTHAEPAPVGGTSHADYALPHESNNINVKEAPDCFEQVANEFRELYRYCSHSYTEAFSNSTPVIYPQPVR